MTSIALSGFRVPHLTSYQVLYLLSIAIICSCFKFAFYKNELYVNIEEQTWDRGYQTIWGLVQLQLYMKRHSIRLNHLVSHVDNIRNDRHDHKELAFWRPTGDKTIKLWPEHDYWGWMATWQAPFPIYLQALESSDIPWNQRLNAMYWTGTVFKDVNPNDIRTYYYNCSTHPDPKISNKILTYAIDWGILKNVKKSYSLNHENDTKPMFMDARRRLMYQYNIYLWGLQWSSSMKRIIATGSVLIMPYPNPHESYISMLLEKYCDDCYVRVHWERDMPLSRFCMDLVEIIEKYNRPDNQIIAATMASKLRQFARIHLSLNFTLGFMLDQLRLMAKEQLSRLNQKLRYRSKDTSYFNSSSQLMYDEYIEKEIHRSKLVKFGCQELLKYHLYEKRKETDFRPPKITRLRWQYYEWYDENCEMRSNASYLMYAAVR